MKNFSAKNAEFETLKINNEAAISSADLGTAPNQIPLNKDLGSLAYQDAVNLDDVSADTLELRAIAAEISDSAVDVFVYDTSRDSDGGAWRKRTSHTSWYNEELNTATRGGRREFPAVAVIVAEVGKVTIYDGDDPDLSMWMVFDVNNDVWLKHTTGNTVKSVEMLNAKLVTAGFRLSVVDFIDDSGYVSESSYCYEHNNISRRNIDGVGAVTGNIFIVNNLANDVAMTILPNAPIDDDTGLPVPTIAVATDGGVSVIKDDGTVVDITGYVGANQRVKQVEFKTQGLYYSCFDASGSTGTNQHVIGLYSIPSGDTDLYDVVYSSKYNGLSGDLYLVQPSSDYYLNDVSVNDKEVHAGTSSGLTKISDNLVNYTTSKYNTGWMPGDIKLATLSDTTVENIGVNSDELSKLTEGSASNTNATWNVVDDTNITVSDYNSLSYFTVAFSKDLIVGQVYEGELIVSNFSGPADSIGFAAQVNQGIGSNVRLGSNGTIKFTFKHQGDDVRLFTSGGMGDMEISIRATTELITNGDFSNGDDGSWADYSSSNLTTSEISTEQSYLGSNSWKFVASLANSGISQSHGVHTEAGKVYTLSGYVYSSTGKLWLRWRNGNDSGYIVDNYELVSGAPNTWLAFSVTANETGSGSLGRIRLVANAAGTFYVDGLSIRPAVDDRSVNNNGLQIVGEVNKTPVAPGADLVAYSGFSANDYLVQPYNEDLDFGTGDFSMMAWIKDFAINGDYQRIFSRGIDGNTGVEWDLYFSTAVPGFRFRYYINGSSTGDTILAHVTNMSTDSWNQIVFSRKDDLVQLHINGSKVYSDPFWFGPADLTNTNARLYVGNRFTPSNSSAFNGSIALARISATAPTDAQIAKIYRDEKALFQDGAQATLYGTSDAVTALAYDDSNQLLHVGTASGRSDFRGLARVNNTTTAISNSISVAEGAIIQN